MASEKEQVPAEETTNGKNGDEKELEMLSLGEIAAIDEAIANAKVDQLQPLHNLFYGKNGSGPQIKRNIRKFAGFDDDERQPKLDQLLTFELPTLQQTVTILDIKNVKADDDKETHAKAIIEFLMAPSGKTIAEVEKENPAKEEDEENGSEEEGGEDEEEDDEEEVKPKGSPRKRAGDKNQAGRPKRATASRVWTNDYGSSEEEEVEEVKPKVGKKRKNESDSGSDYNPNGSDDSDAGKRKTVRGPGRKPAARGPGRRKNVSESEEEESDPSEDFSEEELPKKKKAAPARATPRRGAAGKRGRKRKQETESEEESEEEPSEEEEEAADSDDSEKGKKSRKPAPKSTPTKNSKGRPKRAAPPPKKKKKDESEDEEDEEDEPEESEDDEPLKKPPKKSTAAAAAATTEKATGDGSKAPSEDDIKTLLKDILAEANLEEITMKTVCKKVYAHFPGHDLTAKKDFIKQTVKSLIAA